MGENSKIEWTDHTFNPWMGCTKVSPACTNCYAERDMDKRLGKVQWGPAGNRVVTSEANWSKPLKWHDNFADDMQWSIASQHGVVPYSPQPHYPRVFCASLADAFEDWKFCIYDSRGGTLWRKPDGRVFSTADEQDVDGDQFVTMDDLRRRLFKLIDATPNLNWLLLTKRPENIRRMWVDEKIPWRATGQWHRDNVWLGTSVENQEQADNRIPELLKCRDLSPVLFLSCEPLLQSVNLDVAMSTGDDFVDINLGWLDGINWVIAGGESGPNARPSHPDWFRSIRDQCQDADVPFHFKQWGEWVDSDHDCVTFADHQSLPWNVAPDHDATPMCRVGKKRAGRLLDGRTWDGIPSVIAGR